MTTTVEPCLYLAQLKGTLKKFELYRNVGLLSTDSTALYPRKENHCCENLEAYNVRQWGGY
jgi:hypothetical protein